MLETWGLSISLNPCIHVLVHVHVYEHDARIHLHAEHAGLPYHLLRLSILLRSPNL